MKLYALIFIYLSFALSGFAMDSEDSYQDLEFTRDFMSVASAIRMAIPEEEADFISLFEGFLELIHREIHRAPETHWESLGAFLANKFTDYNNLTFWQEKIVNIYLGKE